MKVLRYVGDNRVCDATNYTNTLNSENRLVIDNISSEYNTICKLTLNQKPLQVNLNPDVRDLLDLASLIYIADEHVDRSVQQDGWARNFEIIFPVYDVDRWSKVESELVEMLKFLSGDRFSFYWEQRGTLRLYGKHRLKVPRGYYDVVCLFSGGVDSLYGAYALLQEGLKVLLVGHHADTVTPSAQKTIFDQLQARFGDNVALIQFSVSRSKRQDPKFPFPDKVETSHRPRSFLFLVAAIAIANTAEIDSIYIPENGLIALNIPLQISRLGTLSTRTAHPHFLSSFIDVVSILGLYSGNVMNPFLYKSKTDMLLESDSVLRQLTRETVSCAHPDVYRWLAAKNVRHCGYCVPCIYRRAAFLEAAIDSPDDYLFDIFNDYLSLSSTTRVDFATLVRFAKQVMSSSPGKLELMIMSQGAFSANIGAKIGPFEVDDYSLWANMISRWAETFLNQLQEKCSDGIKQNLRL